jgi:predicted amidohydrolase
MSKIIVACIQVNSRDDMPANIQGASALVRQAAEGGAQLVSLPEYVSLMDGSSGVMQGGAFAEAEHPALAAFRDLARECAITLHVGSLMVTESSERPFNRSYVITPNGEIQARYDKIHMFDLTLPDGREVFESKAFQPGGQAVVVPTPHGVLGLTICYDLRFPQLFRSLKDAGAEIALVPASFLPITGVDHWHVLVRTRAIDTGMFVVAAAMCGTHGNKRASYGHSLIVDPWGRVLAQAGNEPGIIFAELDIDLVAAMRSRNPWLQPPPKFTAPSTVK